MNGHRAPLSYHARLLGDLSRMDAYERAIRRLVKPGDVVLDVGCGTGILAMLAARRGARVHAVESMPVAELARELVARNGLDVQVHRADVRELAPVEPVDLVVSDFLGCFLVDDGMLDAIAAGSRWLKPGARFCPSEVRLLVAPVADFTLPLVELWREPFYGVDLTSLEAEALRECTRGNLAPSALLAPPQRYHTYVTPAAGAFDATLRFTFERAARLRALAGWFEAQLAEDVVLTTAPGHETHWMQHLFPLPACEVAAGEALEVRLVLDGGAWRWSGAIAGRPFDLREADERAEGERGERAP
jgi:protein arginine N-methyltransferase 1